MPLNTVYESSLSASGEPAPSVSKDFDKLTAQPPSDPISEWLERAALGHARMRTDPEFREQIEQLIAQQLSRTPDPAKR